MSIKDAFEMLIKIFHCNRTEFVEDPSDFHPIVGAPRQGTPPLTLTTVPSPLLHVPSPSARLAFLTAHSRHVPFVSWLYVPHLHRPDRPFPVRLGASPFQAEPFVCV
jgi:hypothetical protein